MPEPQPPSPRIPTSLLSRRTSSKPNLPPPEPDSQTLSQLRADLLNAQQSRSALLAQFLTAQASLDALQSKQKTADRRLSQLTNAVSQLTTKIRDRDQELREKSRLLENIQDEGVALNLQLNVAEDEVKRLRKENEELIQRWMKRVGREADELNEENSKETEKTL